MRPWLASLLVCLGRKLTDSTNLGEGEGKFVSPSQALVVPSPRLSKTVGYKRRINKSQISGPLDLIASPAPDVSDNCAHTYTYVLHL